MWLFWWVKIANQTDWTRIKDDNITVDYFTIAHMVQYDKEKLKPSTISFEIHSEVAVQINLLLRILLRLKQKAKNILSTVNSYSNPNILM